MKWVKQGLVINREIIKLDWYKRNAMMTVPLKLNDEVIRLFITFCDENNIGRVGYVDVDAVNPSKILNYSKRPCLDIGEDGTFDDNGVVSSSMLIEDNKLYMFYSGYQICTKVPYLLLSGIAVSDNMGEGFTRLSKVPILERSDFEPCLRCNPYIVKKEKGYNLYYMGDSSPNWCKVNNKKVPIYEIKVLQSTDFAKWGVENQKVLSFQTDDEHGFNIGDIWYENGKYKMLYSIRKKSCGYRLGYAESDNGIDFKRKDSEAGMDVSKTGFDSDMICFPTRIAIKDKVILFYSGNHYGLDGIGYAILEEE